MFASLIPSGPQDREATVDFGRCLGTVILVLAYLIAEVGYGGSSRGARTRTRGYAIVTVVSGWISTTVV